MTLRVDGQVFTADNIKFDDTVIAIETWYDRHTRDWVLVKLNKSGYQIGDAIRVGNKTDKDAVLADLKQEYGL